jgi:protein-tyrosine phosphatase
VQRSVGVHRDDVMADYLLTNTAGNVAARIAAGAAAIGERGADMSPEVMAVMMGVEAEYLDAAFAAVTAEYGSEDGYLAQVLGADDGVRERLREVLGEG